MLPPPLTREIPEYRRRNFKVWKVIGAICVVLLIGGMWRFVYLMNHLWDWSQDEVARVVSPSGKLEAILIQTNGGATTSFGYLIHVVKAGGKLPEVEQAPASFYRLTMNGSRFGVDLRWKSDALLYADYLSATLVHNSGFVAVKGFERVTIELRSGLVDLSVPSGETLQNIVHIAGSEEIEVLHR